MPLVASRARACAPTRCRSRSSALDTDKRPEPRKSCYPGFPIWTDCRPSDGVHRAARPVGQLVNTSHHVNDSHPASPWAPVRPLACELGHSDHVMQRHRRRAAARCSIPVLPVQDSGSGWMPRESLDAPEDLPKEAPCQVALGQLKDEVPGMPDEASARLGPAATRDRQDRADTRSSDTGPAARGSVGRGAE